MRILFIGDYSNLHTTLAHELRKMGHVADVLSDKCGHMDLDATFYLNRKPGIKGGLKYLYDLFSILPRLKDYDVVQLINTNFLKLKPAKIKYFYDRLKEQNRSMFLTLAGNDYFYVKACHDAKMFRFSEFKIGNDFTPGCKQHPEHMYGWLSHSNKKLAEYIYEDIAGAMSVLPEYDMVAKPILGEKVTFTNLPIDFSQLPEPSNFTDGKTTLYMAMRSGVEHWKGTKTLYKIVQEIEQEMPTKVKVELAQDLSLNDFLLRMAKSDIVLDQLYAYSPAMTALYAMGMGKVAATGGQPEYYSYINEPQSQPLLALSPLDKDIKDRLIELINNPENIILRGKEGRKIALRNNDSKIVAKKFIDHWNKILG